MTLIAPAPLETALMPIAPPVTVAAVIVRLPPDEIRPSMPTPVAALASTSPPALTFNAFAPPPIALIPITLPETAAAETVRVPAAVPAAT